MSEVFRYCSHCGAANAPESQVCFSCQHPFADAEEAAQGVLLHGRYQLLTQVGSGGFGGVYRAVDTAEARRVVAVKEINLRGLSAQEIIEATDGFNREVRLLSALRHPNLPVIRDTFTDAEHWYLVMDFIEGETLETYLRYKDGASLALKEVLEIGLQLCTVLDYLHTREPAIIFRDLKPSNVMRTPGGRIYLIDFGIARLFSPGKARDTMPFGSPGYAAPEQYGRAQTTPQADIYSLGALLHHLLTGSDPAESPFRFAPLPIADSTELAEIDTLLQRMVATDPGERPASVAEVKAILQRLAEQLRRREYQGLLADMPPAPIWSAPVPAPRKGKTRRSILAAALTFGSAAVVIGGGAFLCNAALHYHRGIYGSVPPSPPSPGAARQHLIYRGHKGPITALSWSPDGSMVASGSADGTVQVWRSSDGALLYTLSGYTDAVTSVSWASDRSNVIASAGNDDGTVQIWAALHDQRYLIFHGDGRVLALDWQEHSPWIVSGGTDRDIYTWNATTGARGASYRGHKGNVNTVMWLSRASAFTPGLAHTLPAQTPTATPTPPPTPTPPSTQPPPAILTPMPTAIDYKNAIASGGADGTVQLWDALSGHNILTYTGHRAGVNGLTPVPGYYASPVTFASASDDGTVQVWNVDGLQTLQRNVYTGHHGQKVNAVAALPATVNYYGALLVSASDDQTVQIWSENNEANPLITYAEHHAPVKAMALSPVDNRVVSGDTNGQVHLWTVIVPSYK